MKDVLLALLRLGVVTAKRCGPGGVRAVVPENLLLKQQLIVLHRGRPRAPNLRPSDRLLCGFWSPFLNPRRIRDVAIALSALDAAEVSSSAGAAQVPRALLIQTVPEETRPDRT
jgi:hypothetical protein